MEKPPSVDAYLAGLAPERRERLETIRRVIQETAPDATEDVLYLLNGLGIHTGIDLDALITAGQRICAVLGKENGSRVARARLAKA